MAIRRWLQQYLRQLPGYRQEHPLAHRLTMYVLACSLCFALLSTVLQVGIEYQREMRQIDQRLELIRSGYVASLARSLWDVDDEQLRLQMQGNDLADDVFENPWFQWLGLLGTGLINHH